MGEEALGIFIVQLFLIPYKKGPLHFYLSGRALAFGAACC